MRNTVSGRKLKRILKSQKLYSLCPVMMNLLMNQPGVKYLNSGLTE